MGIIRFYDTGSIDEEETPDAVFAADRDDPASVQAARQAIWQRCGVDLGPLLGERRSWLARVFSRTKRHAAMGAILPT